MESNSSNQGNIKRFLRLVALWALVESGLGGILHGFKLPVTGLFVGGAAMLCIMLIAWYFPQRGSVLKAMMLVVFMKFSLSPHSPFPAYIAVFFQGIMGEFILRNRQFFLIKCLIFGILGMMESALQRMLVLVFISGTEIWEALDIWVLKVTSGWGPERFSRWLAGGYLLVHALAGLTIGRLGWRLVSDSNGNYPRLHPEIDAEPLKEKSGKKKNGFAGPVITILALMFWLLIQFGLSSSVRDFPFFVPLLLRMVWLYGLLVFLLVPVLDFFFKKMLTKKAGTYSSRMEEIKSLLPEIWVLAKSAWKYSRQHRLGLTGFIKLLVYNIVSDNEENHHSNRSEGAG